MKRVCDKLSAINTEVTQNNFHYHFLAHVRNVKYGSIRWVN